MVTLYIGQRISVVVNPGAPPVAATVVNTTPLRSGRCHDIGEVLVDDSSVSVLERMWGTGVGHSNDGSTGRFLWLKPDYVISEIPTGKKVKVPPTSVTVKGHVVKVTVAVGCKTFDLAGLRKRAAKVRRLLAIPAGCADVSVTVLGESGLTVADVDNLIAAVEKEIKKF